MLSILVKKSLFTKAGHDSDKTGPLFLLSHRSDISQHPPFVHAVQLCLCKLSVCFPVFDPCKNLKKTAFLFAYSQKSS
jgi:hypothetical protein